MLTMRKWIFGLMALSTMFLSSCNKDDNAENSQEFTHIGTWQSYNIDELGEYGELVARYATSEYSITFTDTTATLVIEDMPGGMSSISSTYEFKEEGSNIIYFNSAYSNYNLQLVAQITEDNQLILLETCSNWDYSFMYYFKKK